MPNLIRSLLKGKLWDFNGGIYPPEMKRQTSQIPLRHIALAKELWLPLQQHLGPEGELLVKIGDRVLKGQQLTAGHGRVLPIHAPTSGLIANIGPHTTAHPSGLAEPCIQIITDGKDEWVERKPIINYLDARPHELLEKIHSAGIAGLGGAGFPTAAKLSSGLNRIKVLIINAAECEPYITADDRLMQEHSDEIIQGCQILQHILQPETVIIGIEDNKPAAIVALTAALQNIKNIILRVIPTKYPSGGAKQLTKILTGLEIPHGQHSAKIGVLMQNVGTVYAIKRAIINGEPLIERVVTLTGDSIEQPGNLWLPFGTSIAHILAQCDYRPTKTQMVIIGGPLTGFTLPHLDIPLVKISNCILVPGVDEMAPVETELPCIRCTACVDACPAGLLPQQLYWFSRGKEHEKARNYHLFDCIECGACAYVCPSNIPLVQYYRQEKAEIRELDSAIIRSQLAKERFEAKQARVEREKQARQQRHQQAAVKLNSSDTDIVQAALNRVKTKHTALTGILTIRTINGQVLPDNSSVIAARTARKVLAQKNQLEKQLKASAEPMESSDDLRKQAVADAIARAKARKLAQQQTIATAAPIVDEATIDPRKAAVAAAIARAKAKKAQNSQSKQPTDREV